VTAAQGPHPRHAGGGADPTGRNHAMDTTPLTREDREFLYGHARAWAHPDTAPARADAYAAWYVARYAADPATTLGDLPAHPDAWPKFLATWTPAPTGETDA
jgi:hypothetical protein